MRTPRSITSRRVLVPLSALTLALGLSACGHKESHPTYASNEGSASNGFYVDAGPITYQLQISRELNPYSTEDKTYLAGVSAPAPSPTQEWYGVFLWAKNQSGRPATTAGTFTITDTQGNTYYPVPINTAANQLAWTPTRLRPGDVIPAPNSAAYFSATQGEELLFKISNTAYSNRPLTLNIYAPGQAKPSRISLDL